jgi:3-phytase
MPTTHRSLIAAGLLLCATGFAAAGPASAKRPASDAAPPSTPHSAPVVVPEAYVSAESPGDELDSLATWRHPDGKTWLIATAKSSHQLVVFDADTGERLRAVGGKGSLPGQFKRPNGIATLGDRLLVVERDNRRVQVFSLPDFAPVSSFGSDELRAPYGLWLNPDADGRGADLYVTDSFMYGERFDQLPPMAELDQRVRRYRLSFPAEGGVRAEARGHFGDTGERNALRIVESIAGDPAHDRLLIADEYHPKSTLREYTLAGKATGRQLPEDTFSFEAEGVALWSCRRGKGYWVSVDQLAPLTVFHVFDRKSLRRVGSITGRTVATTDGIALRSEGNARFPSGALYAVHADKSVAAFDLRDVIAALKLDRDCR